MNTVHIIDCHNANDYFADRQEGPIVQHLLKAVNIRAELHMALNRTKFGEAVVRAMEAECDVLHIAGHGNGDGIASSSGRSGLLWADFVKMFQGSHPAPKILVMSTCCGASSGLGRAFSRSINRPKLIIGSSDARYFDDYVAAWALLYRRLNCKDIDIEAMQQVLDEICAVVDKSFRYLGWDDERERYVRYPHPRKRARFDVVERE
ncbi:hypothetical protein EN962_03675 [Mesorhizobium sp. M7A.F.Ca.CA.001.09.2.1]|uniref:CHAT domain-containing protein n=2 Tax=Mesorhizobium TaxID=68287 RepID=A0AB38TFP2_9HYPH|nr:MULTISPECIES: hypothetical protein [Mesorhizobium]RUY55888.1 hypothetical protein EN981_06150 [Mesorhizobium sp. M7A.F.Ca.CA.001.13.2.1]RVB48207.1 hypothetical protein EN918_01825 [Mesorhizobium sp. M7A.F.Ca.CA.004.05.1.1]MCF6125689.1 CHAT domain-containing protein [Mesorhizobium ciceri]MCQ8816190.1 CHAT domain-containing protein [Mesorhizobium sp. SEMIA396]MDF3214689.1 hypothetical protein [Mesorhizobium ciceri]